jgi:hypothetical protein
MKAKPKTSCDYVYIGNIPDIFGYGMQVVALTEEDAMNALRNAYAEAKLIRSGSLTDFETSFEYFGGSVTRVIIGKGYPYGFSS